MGAWEGRLVRRRAAVEQTAALGRRFGVCGLTRRATILIAHFLTPSLYIMLFILFNNQNINII